MVWGTIIVSPHHRLVMSIRTDNGNLLGILLQRQDIVLVLKQYDGLTSHVQRYVSRSLGRHSRIRNLRPLHQRRIIHLTQVETTFEQTDHVLINLLLREQTFSNCLGQTLIGIVKATLYIGTCQDGFRCTMYGIRRRLMVLVEVANGTTVAYNEIFKAPLIAQYLLEQTG